MSETGEPSTMSGTVGTQTFPGTEENTVHLFCGKDGICLTWLVGMVLLSGTTGTQEYDMTVWTTRRTLLTTFSVRSTVNQGKFQKL
jgi:hypothetical protein